MTLTEFRRIMGMLWNMCPYDEYVAEHIRNTVRCMVQHRFKTDETMGIEITCELLDWNNEKYNGIINTCKERNEESVK